MTGINNVLLVSMARSGGTLTNNLLDGHPALNVFPLEFWNTCNKNQIRQPYHSLFRFLPQPIKLREVGFHQRLQDMIEELHGQGSYHNLVTRLQADLGKIGSQSEFYDYFQSIYFPEFFGHPCRKNSFNHVARLCERSTDYIRQIFGPVRLSVSIRDPRASLVSYARNLELTRGESMTEEHVESLCALWRSVAHRFSISPEPDTLAIRYEDVVLDTERTMKHLCAFIGVDFHSITLKPSRMGKPVAANSSYDNMTEMTTAPIDRWRKMIDPEIRELVEDRLKSEMEALGYT